MRGALEPPRRRARGHVPGSPAARRRDSSCRSAAAAFAVLHGHLSQEGIVRMEGDDPGRQRVASERITGKQRPDRLHDGDVLGIEVAGRGLLQRVVFSPREKATAQLSAPMTLPWRERTGTSLPKQISSQRGPCRGRAIATPPPDGARKLTTSGDHSPTASGRLAPDLAPFLANHGIRIGWKLVAPIADLRRAHADHLDMTFERRRHWIAGDGRGAADQRQGQQQSPGDPSQRIPPFDAELPEACVPRGNFTF